MSTAPSYTYNPPQDYDEAVDYAFAFAKRMMADWSLRLYDISPPKRGVRFEPEHLVIIKIHDRSKSWWLEKGQTLTLTGYHKFEISS